MSRKVIKGEGAVYHSAIITKLQCKKQAQLEGTWDTLKAALSSDEDMQENWSLTTILDIRDPGVQAMGLVMGKTPAQLQEFFDEAADL